ncbi:MAG: hypothetical protein KKE41_10065, partial [Gammaproteobacteria bacterium]|nr:hypothetical protein [Gammaproteobacteria bacterium]
QVFCQLVRQLFRQLFRQVRCQNSDGWQTGSARFHRGVPQRIIGGPLFGRMRHVWPNALSLHI